MRAGHSICAQEGRGLRGSSSGERGENMCTEGASSVLCSSLASYSASGKGRAENSKGGQHSSVLTWLPSHVYMPSSSPKVKTHPLPMQGVPGLSTFYAS